MYILTGPTLAACLPWPQAVRRARPAALDPTVAQRVSPAPNALLVCFVLVRLSAASGSGIWVLLNS
jgi:hypothetical protein